MANSLRLKTYRLFTSRVVQTSMMPKSFFRARETDLARLAALPEAGEYIPGESPVRIWFHAASTGELECLWTVIQEFARSVGSMGALVLSVFSPSARSAIEKLAQEIRVA